MLIDILYFATLRDLIGQRREKLEVPRGSTIGDLKDKLGERGERIALALNVALFSINREFAFAEETLQEGDEVGVFPPVSGGSQPTILEVTKASLDLDDIVASITSETTGAVCTFTGIVRAKTTRADSRETAYLEYEAYEAMAEEKLQQVSDEIRKKWPAVEGIAIVQRLGHLEPGTPTVLIACSAGHRDSGVFEAARYGIDRLKQIVPIWKKEVGPSGESWVEGKYRPEPMDRSAK
ncbi:MAG: molybdopterin converting factor subunit 1 [Anaerolineales bacterium]